MRTPAPNTRRTVGRRDERGFALVMALLVLIVVSILAVVLISSISNDTKVAGHSLRVAQSLNTAEAGVAEAISRIRTGEIPNAMNPRMVAQVFLATSAAKPTLGTDSVSLGTGQPTGAWLKYSTPARSTDALTVTYKTNTARTQIYRFDPALTPPIQFSSGQPIFEITSTGRVGTDRRRIVTEIYPKPTNLNVQAALTANFGVTLSGGAMVCGYNHRADTPSWKGSSGRLLFGGCYENPLANQWEYLTAGLPSIWTPFGVSLLGLSIQFGAIPMLTSQTSPPFDGPWSVLGMAKEEFYSWVGSPLSAMPADPRGIFYLDNDAVHENQSGSFTAGTADGEGLLYVDGDLTITGNFTYRGLIFVEGDVIVSGNSWTLGAMLIRGTGTIQLGTGVDCTILYSKNAVIDNITKHGSRFGTLSWREIN